MRNNTKRKIKNRYQIIYVSKKTNIKLGHCHKDADYSKYLMYISISWQVYFNSDSYISL